jgi:uncharacterized protein YqhQ
LAQEGAKNEDRLLFGGMARWGGVDFFGPNYASSVQQKDGKIYVWIDPSKLWRPTGVLERLSRVPVLRSIFFWGRLLLQLAGSIWALVFFVGTMAVLWLLVVLMEAGTTAVGGPLGAVLAFLAAFPILPILALFFAAMKFSSIGRYHGAEHKAVSAYEKYGEVTLEGARGMSRLHPRCGTNILTYIILAALISEAWFILGKTRGSVAIGNFMQRYLTTSEPGRKELEAAVGGLAELLRAERGERHAAKEPVLIPVSG